MVHVVSRRMNKQEDNAKFLVELSGLDLPQDVLTKINTEIQKTVLKELASIDRKGESDPYWLILLKKIVKGGTTAGLVARPEKNPPPS